MSVYTAEQLQEVVWKHGSWLRSEDGGERADLSNADLSNADLSNADLRYADLRYANLSYANLRYADLRDANLSDANLSAANLSAANLSYANLNWNSHALLSEILYRAAESDMGRQALAALIGRNTGWCWAMWLSYDAPEGVDQDDWLGIVVDHREWALTELAKWVKDGNDAPDAVRQYAQRKVPA